MKSTAEAEEGEQVVTPWEAKAGEGQSSIDYEKLISVSKIPPPRV